ncbi:MULTISPECIES: hypothetical protein [unclassified Rhodococcus (in: high G+C Gram-positive bacteria)]|uniref:hypothetical protein n=1 Tax=unclassified Rhodococcus (in: high G+C Gram-positive bacteria) TaxID=192944 RepID=UPI0002FDED1F|nr:hypothetical protein [Rhodococcus sp. DK17]
MRRPTRLAPQPAAGARLARRSQVHAEVTREAASTIHSEQGGRATILLVDEGSDMRSN